MTIQEATDEIKSRNKPYVGIMPQSTFANTIRNIEAGLAKQKTISLFLQKFGYDIKIDLTVERSR